MTHNRYAAVLEAWATANLMKNTPVHLRWLSLIDSVGLTFHLLVRNLATLLFRVRYVYRSVHLFTPFTPLGPGVPPSPPRTIERSICISVRTVSFDIVFWSGIRTRTIPCLFLHLHLISLFYSLLQNGHHVALAHCGRTRHRYPLHRWIHLGQAQTHAPYTCQRRSVLPHTQGLRFIRRPLASIQPTLHSLGFVSLGCTV